MNPAILWLKEAIQRLGKKTPTFFKITGTISLIAAILGAIPEILQMLDLTLPGWATGTYTKVMFFVGLWGKIVSNFAVTHPNDLPMTTPNDGK